MAKMFYTAEEAAAKLGKSVDDLLEMAQSGAVQSFKQEDQDMFRVEQIDMMASEDDDLGDLDIALEDSGESDPLSLSGSAPAMDLSAESDNEGMDLDLGGGGFERSSQRVLLVLLHVDVRGVLEPVSPPDVRGEIADGDGRIPPGLRDAHGAHRANGRDGGVVRDVQVAKQRVGVEVVGYVVQVGSIIATIANPVTLEEVERLLLVT